MTTVSIADPAGAGRTGNTPGLVARAILHTRTWPAQAEQLSGIRAHTRAWLTTLGLSAERVADVVLAVNEAVTNAVEHAYPAGGGTVDLTFTAETDTVRVDVIDHGHWRTPPAPATGHNSGHGHGIAIMKRVLDSVTIDPRPAGTRVQLRQARGPAEPLTTSPGARTGSPRSPRR